MYEPSKHLKTFAIAGFQRHDGALVIGDMKVGDLLGMVPERDNPYDPDAIAIGFAGVKLGYVPRKDNELLSLLAFYGHGDIFELRVLKIDTAADPWEQVLVGLYVRDAR